MSIAVEFGSIETADEYREQHDEYVCPVDDDPRRKTVTFVAAQSPHHKPQTFAYAAALTQADPSRAVHATLVYTEAAGRTYDWHNIDDPWTELIEQITEPQPAD